MKPQYDMLFITHLPAFYKVNLYNKIAKHKRVFVIFISDASSIRTADFTQADKHFDYCILNDLPFEKRIILKSLWLLFKKMRKISFKKLIVGGWELPEFWLAVFYSQAFKNQLALESSIFESATQGIRYWIKKLFLSRIDLVYPSGEPHQTLLTTLGYQGKTRLTKGVGLFNYYGKSATKRSFSGKFLFVGRLAPEKNIAILIQAFAKFPHFHLTLVGQGPLEQSLKTSLLPNITMLGHVANDALAQVYAQHDVLVLPSLREPWGLVVEEALFYGLPVIVSDKVGCAKDLVIQPQVGTCFEATNLQSLINCIEWISQHYDNCIKHIDHIDFAQKDNLQVMQYIEALS
ncbi:MAG: glycosyltransferase [Proteobacteria bacterium]|nr:glycosyltransferase [Pseudomonadota bacterium]